MDSTEDEVNVYVNVIKTVALKVNRSETTKKLKELLHEKEGTPENLQELFFTGNQLKNDHKLVDYAFGKPSREKNSTLHLFLQNTERIGLIVYIPSNEKMFGLHAMNHETVKDIKLLIQAKEGILPEQYSLFYDGKLLEDNRTLASLNIQLGTLLYLVFNPIDVMSISVKMPSGKIVKPEVKVLHTIHDVKAIIWSMVGFEDGAEDLTYAGKLLEDSKTLAACNIKEDSLLEMLIWTFKIFVKDLTGKTLVCKVCKEDRVLDVKNKISDKQGGPVSDGCLIFAGYKMEDDRDLASYNVETGSILHWVLRMRG